MSQQTTKHQAFVGSGFCDAVQTAIGAKNSMIAITGSTETEQVTAVPTPRRVVA